MLWFEITKMLIAVFKEKDFIVSLILTFGTLSSSYSKNKR